MKFAVVVAVVAVVVMVLPLVIIGESRTQQDDFLNGLGVALISFSSSLSAGICRFLSNFVGLSLAVLLSVLLSLFVYVD